MAEAVNGLTATEARMRIARFRFGEIVVAGQRYTDDLMVFEYEVRPLWQRRIGHLLQLEDIGEVIAYGPEALIVGTGTQQCLKIAPRVVAETMKAGIELLVFDTRSACQTFNYLLGKRRVVAALHLTC